MKKWNRICVVLGLVILVSGVTACSTNTPKEAKLQAMAKVTRVEAEKIALAKVESGTIKEGEIEEENGKLIWSFDIATPGTSDITEVQVDAMEGNIISVEKENLAAQAKEKEEHKKR